MGKFATVLLQLFKKHTPCNLVKVLQIFCFIIVYYYNYIMHIIILCIIIIHIVLLYDVLLNRHDLEVTLEDVTSYNGILLDRIFMIVYKFCHLFINESLPNS